MPHALHLFLQPASALLALGGGGGKQGKGFYFCEGTQALAPHATPELGPARQGEGTAESIYLTLAAVAGKALGGRTSPSPPGTAWGSQGALERAGGWTGAPLTGRRRPRSALRGLHGPGRGEQGTSLGLLTLLPRRDFHRLVTSDDRTVLSPHPTPRKHGDPSPPCRRPGPAQPPCACSRVCVSVCVCRCVVKLCPPPSPTQRTGLGYATSRCVSPQRPCCSGR